MKWIKMELDKNYDRIFEDLSIEDLKELICLLPKDMLLEPIKSNPTRYSKHIAGFNYKINNLPFFMIQNAYLNDKSLAAYAKHIVLEFMKCIDNNEAASALSIDEINSGNEECFEKLVDILTESPFSENIILYFKLKGIELSECQQNYIKIAAGFKNKLKEQENQINSLHQKEIRDLNAKYQKKASADKKEIAKLGDRISKNRNSIKKLEEKLRDERQSNTELINKIKTMELENKKLYKEINDRKESEIELKKTISNLKSELDDIEKIRWLGDKKDINALASKLLSLLQEDDLTEKFFAFIEKECILDVLVEKEQELYKKFCIIANKKWQQENQNLLNQQNELKAQIAKLESEKNAINTQIKQQKINKIQMDIILSKLEERVQEFIKNMDEQISHHLLSRAVLKPLLDNSNKHIKIPSNDQNLFVENSILHSGDIPKVDVEEFVDNLNDNLQSIGIAEEITYNLACLFVGCICSGLVPLIFGHKTRDIAKAISTAFAGCTPHTVTLPTGFSDAKEIMNQFQKSNSSVVLFEDVMGGINENCLLPLFREWTSKGAKRLDKLLILSTESFDSIKYMTDNLLDYVMVITVREFKNRSNDKFKISSSKDALINMISNDNIDRRYSGKINALTFNTGLGKFYNLQREEVFSNLKMFLEPSIALTVIAELEILPIVRARSMLEQFSNNVIKMELDSRFKNLVEKELINEQNIN